MIKYRLPYNYALIDETGFWYEVRSTSLNCDDEYGFVRIPEYDDVYMEKYYNVADGKWYYDAEFQNEVTELN